jgi:hypothetical protein
MTLKYTKWQQNIPNGRKIKQMTTKGNKRLSLQNPPKFAQIWIFGLKIYDLATLKAALKKRYATQNCFFCAT